MPAAHTNLSQILRCFRGTSELIIFRKLLLHSVVAYYICAIRCVVNIRMNLNGIRHIRLVWNWFAGVIRKSVYRPKKTVRLNLNSQVEIRPINRGLIGGAKADKCIGK